MNNIKLKVQIFITLMVLIISSKVVLANSSIDLDAKLGFGGNYIDRYELPAEINLKNNGDDFEGEISIISSENEYDKRKILFSQKFSMLKAESKTINMKFFKYVNDGKVVIRITNLKELVVYEKEYKMNYIGDKNIIGVLSDNKEYLDSLGKIFADSAIIPLKISDIERTLPNEFTMLIMDSANESFNKSEMNILLDWSNEKSNTIVVDNYIENLDLKELYENDQIITLKNSLIQNKESQMQVMDIYKQINTEDKFDEKSNYNNYYGEQYLERIPFQVAPNLKLLKLLLIIFVILVGPISYLILKKLDLKEWIWITTVVLVIVFSIIIYYIISAGTIDGPLISRNSHISLNDGDEEIKSRMHAFGVKEKVVEVLLDDKNKFSFSNSDWTEYKEGNENIVAKINFEENSLKYKNPGFWNVQTIEVTKRENIGDIEYNLHIKNEHIVGELKNTMQFDISDVVLIYGNHLYFVGDIKKGEILEIDKEIPSRIDSYFYDLGYIFETKERKDYLESIGKYDEYKDNYKLMSDGIKSAMLARISYLEEVDTIKLIGWNDSNIGNNIMINNSKSNYIDRNLFTKDLKIEFKEGTQVSLAYNNLKYRTIDSEGIGVDFYSGSLYNEGFVDLEYKLNSDISAINYFKIEVYDDADEDMRELFEEGKIEVFIKNHKMENWEKLNQTFETEEDLEEYLVDGNIVLRVKLNDHFSYKLPRFFIKGVVKNCLK